MYRFALPAIAIVGVMIIAACSESADVGTPSAPMNPASVSVDPAIVSSTATPREAAIDYLAGLVQLSRDYENSVNDAKIRFEFSHNEGLRFEGDTESLRLVTQGFSNRMRAFQPPMEPVELRTIYEIAVSVVQAELEWVEDYDTAVSSGDSERIDSLESRYLSQLPMAELEQINDLVERTLAIHNIPRSTVRYSTSDFRLTVLDEDYVRVVPN